jgi:hypothetical protein
MNPSLLKLNKAQKIIFLINILLLGIPLIEQFDGNSSINWSFFDFIGAFILLTSIGFSLEFVIRRVKSKSIRVLVIVGILLFFITLWAELAVGIFNSPIAGD